MEENKNSIKSTVVLNNIKSDMFLDFYNSRDLDEVIKVLNKLKDD